MKGILEELTKQEEIKTLGTGLAQRGEILDISRTLRKKLEEFLGLLLHLKDIKSNILTLRNNINATLSLLHSEIEEKQGNETEKRMWEKARDNFIRSTASVLISMGDIDIAQRATIKLINLLGATSPGTKESLLPPEAKKLAKRIEISTESAPSHSTVLGNPQQAMTALMSYLARCYTMLDLLQMLLLKADEIVQELHNIYTLADVVVSNYGLIEKEDTTWEEIVKSISKVKKIASTLIESIDADTIEEAKLDIVAITSALGFLSSPQRVPQAKSMSLLKALSRSPQKKEGKNAAKRKLREGIRNLKARQGKEAFEDFAAVKFHLIGEDCYTETLLSALDKLLDIAWRLQKDPETNIDMSKVEKIAAKIEELIDNPKGEKATPPTRVETMRDARLWEAAKRIVNDNYKNIEKESKRYWALVSRIFTRMRLRLGGAEEKVVEKIVEELREKEGKLPPAGEGSKGAEEVAKLKERIRELLLKAIENWKS